MRSIPVDLILHELAARLAELPDTQHRDLHRAISRGCIRPQSIAEEWTSGAGVAQQAAWLVRRLDGEDMATPRLREIAAETRAMEVAIARRLADCALSLLVTQDAEDAATAQALLQAAQRVVGLATAKPRAEADRFTSATDSAEDGLSPVILRHHLAATRDALGLGSGPVFLSDIVARAKALAKSHAKLAAEAGEWREWAVTHAHGMQDHDVHSVDLMNTITKRLMLLAIDAKATNRLREKMVEIATALRLPTTADQSDIVARARSLADADKARHAAEVENANKASIISKQEELIANLTHERDAWSAWATKLAGQGHEQSSSKALREALSARLIDSKGQRLKVARECLPPNVDIIVCMRGNDPATYKAANTDVEYDTPEAAARAAWEHHQRPVQSVPARAFKVGDRVTTPSGPDGTITSIGTRARVKLDDTSWVYGLADLQHVPPSKFKIGDRVVASDARYTGRYFYVASVYRDMIGVSVKPEDGHGFTFTATDLSLVPLVEPSPTA